jgi:hypothetical protein
MAQGFITQQQNFTIQGIGSPTVIPQFIGQQYIDVSTTSIYIATNINSINDWKNTYFSPSYIRKTNGSTRGSTNTNVVIYSTMAESSGSDITYVNSAANGDSFYINTNGIYSITTTAFTNSGTAYDLDIKVGSSINNSVSDTNTRVHQVAIGGYSISASWIGYIFKNQIIWVYKSTAPTSDINLNQITISRIS